MQVVFRHKKNTGIPTFGALKAGDPFIYPNDGNLYVRLWGEADGGRNAVRLLDGHAVTFAGGDAALPAGARVVIGPAE